MRSRQTLLPVKILALFAVAATATVAVGMQRGPAPDIHGFLWVESNVATGGHTDPGDLADLKALGIKAVVSLQFPTEHNMPGGREEAERLGLRYFNIPVSNRKPKDDQVEEFLKILGDNSNRPIFIHCMAGNRVGAFWMIRRVLVEGWTIPKALKEAKKIGLSMRETEQFALDYIERHKN